MIKFIARRLGTSLMVLLLGSALMYVLTVHSGDPLAEFRENTDPNSQNLMRQRADFLQLDVPWYQRYFQWLGGAAGCLIGRCDLGVDAGGRDVTALVADAAGSTLRLVTLATVLAIIIGILLGVVTAVRQYSGFDYGVTLVAFVFFSLPVFWAAVLLKHYAAIEFNSWLADPSISLVTILVVGLLAAVIMQSAAGGHLRRRLTTMAVVFGAVSGVLLYFDRVAWFRRPSVGLPIYVIAVLGAAVIVLILVSGLRNKAVRNALIATAVINIVGYAAMRSDLMKHPSNLKLFLCLVAAVALAVVAGLALGGFSRREAILGSVVLSLVSSSVALADLFLSNWAAYIKLQPRPIPTVGSETPNFESTYWMHFIDIGTHLLLPTILLTLISIASYTRYTRASMLEVLNQDYIRTARSKGISERRVIMRHALRNSLIPLATIIALDFAALIAGAVVTESVFGWQGMGQLFATGLKAVDPNPVMGFYLVTGTAAVAMNLVADILYASLDPRITR